MKDYNNKYHFNNLIQEGKIYKGFKLFQFGDLQCQENSLIPTHNQYCYEISYIVSGKGVFYINSIPVKVEPGDVIFCLKNDEHSILSDETSPLRFFFVGFDIMLTSPLYPYMKILEQQFVKPSQRCIKDKFEMGQFFIKGLAEFANPNELSDFLKEHLINSLIAYSVQNFNILKYTYSPQMANDKETLVYNIISYLDNNAIKIKSISELSGIFNYSISYISHLFSEYVGKTLAQYLNDKKLSIAKTMIEQKVNITEIAEKLGYSSIHPFSRAFKAKFGISPTKYTTYTNL